MLSARSCVAATFALVVMALSASRVVAQDATADPKVEAGENVYNARCATCHGDDLINTTGQAFDLRRLRADERPRFDNSVRNGKNQMPPWKGVLSDDEIDQLWHYIRANAYEK
jgi:mono/diheme cytochrome c family protein